MVAGFPLPDYDRNHTEPPELAEQLPPLLDFADRIGKLSDARAGRPLPGADRAAARDRDALAARGRARGDGGRCSRAPTSPSTGSGSTSTSPATRCARRCWRCTAAIDAMVGEARELLGAEGAVAVVSDHGFGPHPRTFVRTDRLLADAGLLSAGGEAGRGERVTRALRRAPALRRVLRKHAGPPAGRRPRPGGRPRDRRQPGRLDAQPAPTGSRSTRPPRASWSTCAAARQQGAVEPGDRVRAGARPRHRSARGPARSRHRRSPWCSGRSGASSCTRARTWTRRPDVVVLFDPAYKGASGLGELFEPVPEPDPRQLLGRARHGGRSSPIAGARRCRRASTSASAASSTWRRRCWRCSAGRCRPTRTVR